MGGDASDNRKRAHGEAEASDLEVKRLAARCARLEQELATKDAIMAAAFSQVRSGFVVVEAENLRILVASLQGLGIQMPQKPGVPLFVCTGISGSEGDWNWRLLRKDGSPYTEDDHPLAMAVLRGESTKSLEAIIERADGETRWVLVNAVPLPGADANAIAGLMTMHDVGQLKAVEAERIQGLSFFAHDMKSPLFGARSFVERLLTGKTGPLTEAQHKELSIVRDLLDRVLDLAIDFLDLARMDKDGFALSLQPLDLKPMLERLGNEFSVRAVSEGLEMSTTIDPELRQLRGDARRLERVLVNLLDNAIKYTLDGNVQLIARNGPEEWIIIEVLDEGPGLTKEDMVGLFKTFHRGAAGEGTEGSGLGLAAARSIVEAHGGAICAANRFPTGACFTVLLPGTASSKRATPLECPPGR